MSKPEKMKLEESEKARNLLKKQNRLLEDSLEALNQFIYLQKSINLLSSENISKVMQEKLPHILSVKYFSFFLFDKDHKTLKLMSHNHPDLQEGLSIHQNDSPIMKEAMKSGKYIFEQDFASSQYFRGRKSSLFKCGFFISIPLTIEEEIIGVMNLNDNERGFYNISDIDFALSVSEFVALSLNNALLFEKVEKLSVTDGLTGLTNHHQMQAILKNEVIRCQRYESSLSIVMMDIDYFKGINDSYGHQKGDEILVYLASTIKKFCRSMDIAARYGGEEFILILPETKVQGAFVISDRIRLEMANHIFRHKGKEFKVTVSCGIAEFNAVTINIPSDLIKIADQALYKAKHEGRNRTIVGKP